MHEVGSSGARAQRRGVGERLVHEDSSSAARAERRAYVDGAAGDCSGDCAGDGALRGSRADTDSDDSSLEQALYLTLTREPEADLPMIKAQEGRPARSQRDSSPQPPAPHMLHTR